MAPDLDRPGAQVSEPWVCLEGASLRYGDATALDDVSITVVRGERVAILGPSGAGKSSLIALANASLRPSAGSVHLFGQPLATLRAGARRALRRRIGTVHQQPPLPGALRVVHNVNAGRLGHWSTWRSLSSLLRPRELDVARRALALFGVGDKLWRRTDELSGGERQRVALARIVVQGAELVLADEPVASLDPARADEVLALLCGRREGDAEAVSFPTVIASMHDVTLALGHFDRVIGLRRGRVVFDRPAGEVTPGLIDRLYDLATDR